MIDTSQNHRFITKKEASQWLNENKFKQVRGIKGYFLNDKYSANLQHMPSGTWVVIILISDRGLDMREIKFRVWNIDEYISLNKAIHDDIVVI